MSFLATNLDATTVLFDTLLWTAALIALVLLLRRPVTRWFGAPAAYALWALPMLRLILPPIELPAWLAPETKASAMADLGPAHQAILVEIAADAPTAMPIAVGEPTLAQSIATALSGLPLTELALTAWLGGAAVFVYLRFSAYFRLRHELTDGAREVGAADGPLGKIRLIETPGTTGPLAFGVVDPVIALPEGFMASVDREARDLALAHELEHHRGHDLLINILVQPLFALHWFNPLGRYGWLALRRDQEAACDARVMASASRESRAIYAEVIASFAAGPNVALAAPMACPVLGDKSIIQRLRNLKMTEQSSNTKSRKMASRLMLGAAVLALPLTASITYAERLAPIPPAPPAPTENAMAVPAPPPAPAPSAVAAPVPPVPPIAPSASLLEVAVSPTPPSASAAEVTTIVTVDPDTGETETIDIKTKKKSAKTKTTKVKVIERDGELTEEEIEEVLAEVREGLAEADEELRAVRIELKEMFEGEDWAAMVGGKNRTFVRMSCDSGSDDVATTKSLENGGTEVVICQSRIMAQALVGLEQARAAIAENSEMQSEMREEVLKELDQQIENWRKEAR
ncbi:MAG: M56 family metallopeptidase [Pseudomonadota bacterium]